MAKLTDRTSVNPMPECKSDEELAVICKHLFKKNQKKIRADLDQFEEYEPSMVETVFELSKFAAVSGLM